MLLGPQIYLKTLRIEDMMNLKCDARVPDTLIKEFRANRERYPRNASRHRRRARRLNGVWRRLQRSATAIKQQRVQPHSLDRERNGEFGTCRSTSGAASEWSSDQGVSAHSKSARGVIAG